jgi:hypothetical protein
MKAINLKSVFVICSLFVALTAPALAQDLTPTPTITPIPTNFFRGLFNEGKKLIQDFRQERQEDKQEIKDDRQGLRGTITQERLNLQPTLTEQRLNARRHNLQTLYDEIRLMLTKRFDFLNTAKTKIAAKISDLKALGKDVSAAETELATFNPADYNTDLAAFDKKFTDLLSSSNPKQLVKDLQSSAKTVRSDLQDLHRILIDTLRLVIKAK